MKSPSNRARSCRIESCRIEETKHWVFAYGSNMHQADLHRWFDLQLGYEPRIFGCVPAELLGYRLVWNYYSQSRGGGAANVEPVVAGAAGESPALYGVALLVDEPTRRGLDRKEGCPLRYVRTEQAVVLADGVRVSAWVYAVRPEYTHPRYVAPRQAYVDLMIEAAQAHGLPLGHVAALKGVVCCEDEEAAFSFSLS